MKKNPIIFFVGYPKPWSGLVFTPAFDSMLESPATLPHPLDAAAVNYYDAHNHLQDERFGSNQAALMAECARTGVKFMAVNGSCEADWPEVESLAQKYSQVIPCFGCHPWYVKTLSPDWLAGLIRFLDRNCAPVGEIGLDRWKEQGNTALQEQVFSTQLHLAAERNLPVSIHCLQAWGRLMEILSAGPLSSCGFVLHSYGGARELIPQLVRLGAYFSFPGVFFHERKFRQREAFQSVPLERLLVETDAPDQLLPAPGTLKETDHAGRNWESRYFSLMDSVSGKSINHPANLGAVYAGLASILRIPEESLVEKVEENFLRLFGRFCRQQ